MEQSTRRGGLESSLNLNPEKRSTRVRLWSIVQAEGLNWA